jgi:poly(A) polymerase
VKDVEHLDYRKLLQSRADEDPDVSRLLAGGNRTVRTLQEAGFEAYFVGGAVRDLILGRPFKEIDITTNATPERIRGLFRKTVAVGEAFGVVCVIDRGLTYEVATFRQETGYSDGRHPDRVEAGTLQQDVERRDFTMNALVMEPLSGRAIDLVGGLADLAARRVRAIGDPVARMAEDYLRTLRAARFVACLGFSMDEGTLAAVRTAAPGLGRISRERVRLELEKMCQGRGAEVGLGWMDKCGLVPYVFPCLPVPLGSDSVRLAQELVAAVGEPLALPELIAAVHIASDPGLLSGPETRAVLDRRALTQADDLKLSVPERKELAELLLVANRLPGIAALGLPRRADFYRQNGFAAASKMVLAAMKARARDPSDVERATAERASLPEHRLHPPRFLTGDDLAAHGLPPGPLYGSLLRQCSDLIVEGRIETREQALAWLARASNPDGKHGSRPRTHE